MKINEGILHTLAKVAAANPAQREKLAAAVVCRNKIISVGMNSMKSHPMAAKYGKKPAQIILNWHIKGRGHMIIPKTTKVQRLQENFQVFDFSLTKEEYESISALDMNARLFNPKFIDGFGWNGLPYFD